MAITKTEIKAARQRAFIRRVKAIQAGNSEMVAHYTGMIEAYEIVLGM